MAKEETKGYIELEKYDFKILFGSAFGLLMFCLSWLPTEGFSRYFDGFFGAIGLLVCLVSFYLFLIVKTTCRLEVKHA